jgi:hypothetical protein
MGKGNPRFNKPAPAKVARRPVAQRPERQDMDRRPVFSLEHADRGSEHSFHFTLNESESKAVLDFLRDISTTTWGELRGQTWSTKSKTHRKHHEHAVDDLCAEAKARLAAMKLDEVVGEDLFRFRVNARGRLWGFLTEHTFHVLWWDPEHDVYPT